MRHEWVKTGENVAEIRYNIEDAGLTDEMETFACVRCKAYGDTYLVGLGTEREDRGACPARIVIRAGISFLLRPGEPDPRFVRAGKVGR